MSVIKKLNTKLLSMFDILGKKQFFIAASQLSNVGKKLSLTLKTYLFVFYLMATKRIKKFITFFVIFLIFYKFIQQSNERDIELSKWTN